MFRSLVQRLTWMLAQSQRQTRDDVQSNVRLLYLVKESAPIYELDLSTPGRREDSPHLAQFIVSAALDELEAVQAASFGTKFYQVRPSAPLLIGCIVLE